LEVSIPTPADSSISEAKLADNAVTLAKMAGGTDGQIITYDASGDPVAVGPGTDGQVLTSTGAGSPPAFEAIPASGAWAVKTSGTVSSVANLDITGISKWTQIRLFNMRLTSGSGDVFFRTSSNNGSSFDSGSSDYDYSRDQIGFQGTTQNASSVSTVGQPYSSTTEDDCMIIVDIPNPTGTSYTIFKWQMIHADGGDSAPTLYRFGMGIRASSADVDAFQIGVASGAFSASYIVTELN
jgi:hypothetical protein